MSNFSFDLPKNQSNVIKVIGVGGGGSNAINYMFKQGIKGVDFVICNTDSQALENSPVPAQNRIQLGASLTEGLGAGANPEVGQQAAIESLPQLEKMLDTHTKMVFITAGMGGGTGTGAAPEIAKLAKSKDILTVGIVTIPFQFEGKVRTDQAMIGLEKLKDNVDSLIVINNNKLRDVYGNLGFKAGFSKADQVLATASRGIAEVITHHYTQNIDLKDAKTVLYNSGTAIMGSASASGENRAKESIVAALDSPLLNDNKITGAKNVLLLIVSGNEEITIDEIGEINDYIQAEAGNNANIIMGVGEDENLGDSISVTVIATGFNAEQQKEIVNLEPKRIIHALEDEQKNIIDLSPKPILNFSLDTSTPLPKKDEITTNEVVSYSFFDESEIIEVKKSQGENTIIKTDYLISNIEVSYEIVAKNIPYNFVKTTPEIQEIIVEEPKYIIIEKPRFYTDTIKEEEPVVFNFDSINEIKVKDAIELIPTTEVDNKGVIRFELEEYTNLANEQNNAKPKVDSKPIDEELNFSLKSLSETEDKKADLISFNPMEMTLEETMKLKAIERSNKLKQYNHVFSNIDSNIDDLERQPAYKRIGVEFNDSQTQNIPSRTSVDSSNGNVQLKSNNSFLHDNVD